VEAPVVGGAAAAVLAVEDVAPVVDRVRPLATLAAPPEPQPARTGRIKQARLTRPIKRVRFLRHRRTCDVMGFLQARSGFDSTVALGGRHRIPRIG
jgi:hypothetical protein